MTIDEITSESIILKSVVGSRLYNLHIEGVSDTDVGGIVMDRPCDVLNVEGSQNGEIADERQNTKFFGLRKYLHLAGMCNPNVIEWLFLPKEAILIDSPVYQELLKIRDAFISKRAKYTFTGYAYAQIKKAKGIGKKGNSVNKFINDKGLEKLRMWLTATSATKPESTKDENWSTWKFKDTINQAGLLGTFGHFVIQYLQKLPPFIWTPELVEQYKDYDWFTDPDIKAMMPPRRTDFIQWFRTDEHGFPFRPVKFEANPEVFTYINSPDPSKYDAAQVEGMNNLYRLYHNGTGFVSLDEMQVICHSISKERELRDFAGIVKIDVEGYERAKKEYYSFWEWMANRNESRYTKDWNSDTCVDNKNLMHTVRLLLCAEHLAKTGEPLVRFEGQQRDYLMSIRQGKVKYEDLIAEAEQRVEEINNLFEKSTLPNSADIDRINKFYMEQFYKNWKI